MLARLTKFAALGAADKALLLRTTVLVGGIRLALWVLPFRVVHRWTIAAADRAKDRAAVGAHSVSVLTTIVQVVSKRVPGATCLTQALAAKILLAQAGHSATLRIGVGRAAGKFKAHAWIECEGRIVLGEVPGMNEFTPLPEL